MRNNALNANDFFNNRNGVKRPVYKYNTGGFSLGGPLAIGGLNRSKTKLFGFYNLENLWQRVPNSAALTNYTMPTALERKGDFSQTFDTNGKVIPVNDPNSNPKTPFPGNVVPANRLDPNGLALLNILPQPNFLNPAVSGYNYNYQIQEVQNWPKRFQVFKIDYVPRERRSDLGARQDVAFRAAGLRRCIRRHAHRVLRAMLLFFGGGDCSRLDSRLFACPRLRNDRGGTPQS